MPPKPPTRTSPGSAGSVALRPASEEMTRTRPSKRRQASRAIVAPSAVPPRIRRRFTSRPRATDQDALAIERDDIHLDAARECREGHFAGAARDRVAERDRVLACPAENLERRVGARDLC